MNEFLKKYRNNIYSQNGEDGIIAEAFRRMGITGGLCVEFGASDGITHSNTAALLKTPTNGINQWAGLLIENNFDYRLRMDMNMQGANIIPCFRAVTPSNINSMLAAFKSEYFHLLSIDIDGGDYLVWQAIDLKPSIVIIEINSSIYPTDNVIQQAGGIHRGTSYMPMVELGLAKGYFLLCHTGNLIFIKNKYRDLFPELDGRDPLTNPDEYFDTFWLSETDKARLLFLGSKKSAELLIPVETSVEGNLNYIMPDAEKLKAITETVYGGIDKLTWLEAQRHERAYHDEVGIEAGIEIYRASYANYFKYVGIEPGKQEWSEKTIIEIGCADFPAIEHCRDIFSAIIIEPLPSAYLWQKVNKLNEDSKWTALISEDSKWITLITQPVEEITEELKGSEVWIFNVMQHILNPEHFIKKIKEWAPVIRFFEPIDTVINECHPHTFNIEFYQRHFGAENTKRYNDRLPGFHTADCAYGVWRK